MTRFGRWYIGGVGVVGAFVLAYSAYQIGSAPWPWDYRWMILGLLTWLSSSFAIRVPKVAATIYVSEAFFFTIVLLCGAEPAALIMAVDGLLISLRRKNREPYRIIFNVTEPSLSVFLAAKAYAVLAPPAIGSIGNLLLPAGVMAAVYFLLNSGLTAIAVTSETGIPPFRVWREHFMWLWLNYFGGASVALMIALNAPQLNNGALILIVPLVIIFWLTFKRATQRVEDANHHLTELNQLYLSTVETLAMAIDAKDQITHGHIRRVQTYAVGLARVLGVSDERELKAIEAAALLHDMGKLAIPEHILNKPGKLTASEYDRMKSHASVGAQILSAIDFPYPVVPIVRHHHENWDGTGYPDGLEGEGIPIGARIMAVVDCYDALTSDRPYRPALSDEDALDIIKARRGTMYDPAVTDAFIRVHLDIGPGRGDETSHEASAFEQLRHNPGCAIDADVARGSRELTAPLLALADLAGDLAGHVTVEDFGHALGSRLRETIACDTVALYLVDKIADDVVAVAASGTASDSIKGRRLPRGEGLSGWVAVNRATIANSSGALDFGDARGRLPVVFNSALATPLVAANEIIGVLTLYAVERDAFSSEHQQVAEFAARQIGPGLERALAYERERTATFFDKDTGLPNERYLERVLGSAIFSPGREPSAPGLLSLVVHSKTATAVPGDLVRLAATARNVVRVTDLVFRTGACEVMVLMADTTPSAMASVTGRIVENLREQATDSGVAIEAAFAVYPDHVKAPSDLPRAARARRATMLPLAGLTP